MISSLYKSAPRFEDFSHIWDFYKDAMKSFLWLTAVIALFNAVSAEKDNSGCMGECPLVNPNDDVYFLRHKNCSQFCSCAYGTAFVIDCPPNLHYSPKDHVCTYPYEANCTTAGQNEERSVFLTAMSAFADGECIGTCPSKDIDEVTTTLEHQHCDKYCKCVQGAAYEHQCPLNLHYSPVLATCTLREEAKCSRWTTPKPDPSPTNGWCPCPDPTPTPTRPTDPTPKPTRPTDPTPKPTRPTDPTPKPTRPTDPTPKPTRPTDPTPKPTRPTDPTPEPTRPTYPTPKPTNRPPSMGVAGCRGKPCPPTDPAIVQHRPHDYCILFCKCDSGKPIVFSCPLNLYFNPTLEVCDFPEDSGCEGIRD